MCDYPAPTINAALQHDLRLTAPSPFEATLPTDTTTTSKVEATCMLGDSLETFHSKHFKS
jgi:hypothetical protein